MVLFSPRKYYHLSVNASFCFQQAQSAGRCQIHFLYRGTAATAPGPWATWEMLSTCSLWEHILFSSGWSGWKPLTAQKCTLVYKYKYKVDLSSGQDKVLSLSCHSYQFPLISSCHAQTRAQTCTPKWSSWEPHHCPIPLWTLRVTPRAIPSPSCQFVWCLDFYLNCWNSRPVLFVFFLDFWKLLLLKYCLSICLSTKPFETGLSWPTLSTIGLLLLILR